MKSKLQVCFKMDKHPDMENLQWATSHQLALLIVKDKHIHEGYWRLNFEMNMQALELSLNQQPPKPTMIAQIVRLGIMRVIPKGPGEIDEAIVDAEMENPSCGIIIAEEMPKHRPA
jgi:hypothetical protein